MGAKPGGVILPTGGELPACTHCGTQGLTSLAWPRHSGTRGKYSRRYLLCTYCGHRNYGGQHSGGSPPAFTPEQVKMMASMYQQGLSSAQIADNFFCFAGTVRRHLRAAGFELRKKGGRTPYLVVTQTEARELKRLHWDLELSIGEIARLKGVHGSTVRAHMRKAGLEVRPTADQVRLLRRRQQALRGPRRLETTRRPSDG